MLETYETVFGIYNHHSGDQNIERSLASVAMHYAENTGADSVLDERLRQFSEKQVWKYFGLSLTEFLEYPRDMGIRILELSGKRMEEELRTGQSIMSQLENQQGGKG